jgi:uncharacterized damage-inducible protein DinB
MAIAVGLVKELDATRKFFNKTTSIFEEGDASYAPEPGLYTVAGHIAHSADTVDWFVEGGFGKGWDLDFDTAIAKARAVVSLRDARDWLERSFDSAIKVIGAASDATLNETIPDERIMAGSPRRSVVGGIVDHTAHHRGALTVYARLIGKEAPMPYM